LTINAPLEPLAITESQITIREPWKLSLRAEATLRDKDIAALQQLRFEVSFTNAQKDVTCGFSCFCKQPPRDAENRLLWECEKASD
jgi:hypothetical protein